MNRLKGAFEEGFQELKQSERKVRQRVLSAVEQPPAKKSKLPMWMTSIAAILIIGIAGILATQFIKPKQQVAIIFDDTYYDMVVYDHYELSNFFLTEPEVKKIVYETYIRNVAVIEYAKSLDLPFDDEKLNTYFEDNKETIDGILAEQPDSWLHYRFDKIEQNFGITLEKFLQIEKENVMRALVSREMLIDKFSDEISQGNVPAMQFVDERALAYLEEHYSEDLQAFREKHSIDLSYKVHRRGQNSGLVIEGETYETVTIDGQEVFRNTQEIIDKFMFQFKDVIQEIESREGLTLFCYIALDDYMRGAEKLLADEQFGDKATLFIELSKILKNSAEVD